jgi:Ser/Thr protein kinase RdoA (MazF antagonist)
MLSPILSAYGLEEKDCSILPFGSGLINKTWLIQYEGNVYILQRINHQVFREPHNIAANIEMIGRYLAQHKPGYLFVEPVKTTGGESMVYIENEGYFRLFPFVNGSHTIDAVSSPGQSYEAALQFGRFTKLLSGIEVERLHTTLPDFHNLSLRYDQFLEAVNTAGSPRKEQAAELVSYLGSQKNLVDTYKNILQNPSFRLRVTHHDTKISNVLFDEHDKGLGVIDLDTVMSGYFISDIGDMMRTYLSPVTEEEKDFSRINIREDFFISIVKGYLVEMEDELTAEEKKYFVYAGKFMIYMQALRFLADFLNNDNYYGQKYEGHNLVRAGNQAALLQRLTEKENELVQLMDAAYMPLETT